MPVPSARIAERLSSDFGPSAPPMLSILERLAVPAHVDPERIHAAVLIAARGNRSLFEDALDHAQTDWRDLLERTGLDGEGWAAVIDERVGEAPE